MESWKYCEDGLIQSAVSMSVWKVINPFSSGAAYIRIFILYEYIKYNLLNMLKKKCDINQQYLKTVDLHFVKSE